MLAKEIKPFLKNLRGAIHVGANIGEERFWYEAMGFTSVLWFEPNKAIFSQLSKNIKPFGNQFAFNIGIHDLLKRAILHISNNDGQSSSLLQLGTHAIYHPDVKYVDEYEIELNRLDYFLEDNEFDIKDFNFINIDVQGTELHVLRSVGDQLGELDYIYLEVNDEEVYKECALLSQIDNYLDYYNFIRIKTKITKAHWGDALYVKEGVL